MEVKNFMLPVCNRLKLKGINMGEFFNKKIYKVEKYNNTLTLQKENIGSSLKGVALQTYLDIKTNNFTPLPLIKVYQYLNKEYEKLDKKYIKSNIIYNNENALADFCYLYSDIEARTRCLIFDELLDVNRITDKERYNLFKLYENVNNFMNYKKFEIEYREVGFNYTETYNNGLLFNTCYGDLDFITNKKTILDLKCCKTNTIATYLSQQILYYLMGCLGENSLNLSKDYFKSINEVGFYNPILDTYIYIKLDKIPCDYLMQILDRVMKFPLEVNKLI